MRWSISDLSACRVLALRWPRGDAARGALLAREGDPRHQVGACFGCHGQPDNPAPRIDGQHPRPLATWLRLWREGPQVPGPDAARMAAEVSGLEDSDIADLAAYLSQTTLERRTTP